MNEELYYSVPEVAERHGISTTTVKNFIRQKKINAIRVRTCDFYKVGSKRLIPESELKKLEEKYPKKCDVIPSCMSQPEYYSRYN